MILPVIVYLMEMIVALIPAFVYWCRTESTIMAGAVYIIALYSMVRFTMWFVNRPEKLEQYPVYTERGLMHKVTYPDGRVEVFVHQRFDGTEEDIEKFAKGE